MTTTIDRNTGLGASDAAAAIGVSPWKSRFSLWGEKTGLVEPPDLSEKEAVQWGTYLQPRIAEVYAERTGRIVRQNRADIARHHPDHPWMWATPDASQRENGGAIGCLEIKTTNAFAGDQWSDEPPLYYQCQLQHQLAVTGYEWGTLCVLIGGQKLVWFDQPRHDRFIAAMIEKEAEFWALVVSQTPPPVDGSADTAEALKRLYTAEDGTTIDLPAEAAEWDRELRQAKEQIKALEGIKREMENKLKGALGQATYGLLPDGGRYQWKERERNEQAREARTITYRELRRLKK